ncbi:3-oxoacyl-[acyl-carrier-protein] synthase I [Desulfuromusa kysingii]|uniref:3-oxoacyl-[acyl-carrier-protein] synthase 1 n=1 Tax=Desulfuromusa kysingii TaxID=37625 RepID=A0A1H3VNQ8_9BACT|nr:beta-ketoacyl-[acyl-carrier-protein] synthase family protein [Desulfuromusa kysingii]SDZ76379.1 3-oxoacyl-[acyl-carrier-protein] synthase I [Desulfuromusa kysingii]
MYRVAITGIGIVSCLGNDLESVGAALRNGQSGIVVDPQRVELGFRSPLTGQIKNFDTSILSRKQRKSMPEFAVWAYASARDALEMSGLDEESLQNDQSGLIYGCDSSCLAAIEQVEALLQRGETKGIGSGQIFRSMTSTVTMNLNTLLKTRGACWTLSSACSSSGHAVGQAADLIRMGRQERMICGGAQEVNWQSMCSFDGLGAFSAQLDDPATASRPFDADRDGLVPSGGAASVILERYDLAEKRGATILGELLGYGFSSDGAQLSVPSEDGLSRAMRSALQQSGLATGEIDYLCAHATATPAGDAAEATNIRRVFGDTTPDISALKALTGHELWMSGAAQVVYTAIMAQQGFTAASYNFNQADAGTAGLNIIRETRLRSPGKVLCNSAGFGGTNSSLVIAFS